MSSCFLLSLLPYELVLDIARFLEFSDIWYLGTCSRQARKLAYQILKSQYHIDLIEPRIINPFGHSIHAAVAYLERHGRKKDLIDLSVLRSVANQLAIAIYDRLPSHMATSTSLDFLLVKTLSILLDHCLFDPTLYILAQAPPSNNQKYDQLISSMHQRRQQEQPFFEISTGMLMVDFLVMLYDILSALLEEDIVADIHHRVLMSHLTHQLNDIRRRYQASNSYLSQYSSMSIHNETNNEFKRFAKFVCSLAQTKLVSCRDVDEFATLHLNYYFMTRPTDVSFSVDSGLKIRIQNHNHHLAIVNTVTHEKQPAYQYEWKLWLEETQLRLAVLLDLLWALIKKNYNSGEPPVFTYITAMLQETVSALSLTQDTQ